ncbi:related to aromatic amino acid aminotransferase I [Sporisorium reilianum f. sp. reilianum]|uniref:Related to aromatic amino acid aminotransferase I n=1 Tax=Sporisorium reilianum f. sp. reilianum TaxID=72559 RepID=A0A2N8UFN4_9BASI|nr:related to aromatic amino acid aminotransferase I [Sporisorium reilianum f. sp. reilianum]
MATSPRAQPLDYAALLSHTARNRMPSAIRSLFPAELIPGMVSLLSGKPNSATFPFQRIVLELKPAMHAEGETETVAIEGADLDTALQYSATSGIPKLVEWIEEFQAHVHARARTKEGSRPGEVWRCSFGNGSQDLLTKTFEALIDAGDSAVLESPAYSGILPSLVAHKANLFEAATDAEGVEPTALDALLSNWSTSPATRTAPFPKFLYTTPTGANPSGTSASDDRKRAVLAVVRKHNLLLLEDDPYYFLSFQGLTADADPVTRQRGKSYFHLDAHDDYAGGVGRVLRFDSFSKILSAGLRLGFVTGPKEILDAIDLDTSSRNLQTSGTSQAIAYALLSRWGVDGFLTHADSVARFYQDRLEHFESSARTILTASPSIASWVRPIAGMFLWIKLKLPPSPTSADGDSFELISTKAKAAGVLALPGVAFKPPSTDAERKTSAYVRTSFSQVPLDQVDTAFTRLRGVVEEAWREAGLDIPA